MPKKGIAKEMIENEQSRSIIFYLEGWSLKTAKDRTVVFTDKLWEGALTPNTVNALIKYIAGLESDRKELLRAEEQIRRISYGCYGKCVYYNRISGK